MVLKDYDKAGIQLEYAVQKMLDAGRLDFMPRVLLYRASYFRSMNQINAAKGDLDEALEIAKRTHMRLYEADCWLLMGNLWLDVEGASREGQFRAHERLIDTSLANPLVKARAAYGTAKNLIEEMGYGLRRVELHLLYSRLEYYSGNRPDSRERIGEAINVIEDVRRSLRAELHKVLVEIEMR